MFFLTSSGATGNTLATLRYAAIEPSATVRTLIVEDNVKRVSSTYLFDILFEKLLYLAGSLMIVYNSSQGLFLRLFQHFHLYIWQRLSSFSFLLS